MFLLLYRFHPKIVHIVHMYGRFWKNMLKNMTVNLLKIFCFTTLFYRFRFTDCLVFGFDLPCIPQSFPQLCLVTLKLLYIRQQLFELCKFLPLGYIFLDFFPDPFQKWVWRFPVHSGNWQIRSPFYCNAL